MQKVDLYISNDAPNVRSGAWLKPMEGGFELLILDGNWKPLKLADSKAVSNEKAIEDAKTALIGSVQDERTANTINGAKAYAKSIEKTLRNYVDKELKKLE